MSPNPDFVDQVKAQFPEPQGKVVVVSHLEAGGGGSWQSLLELDQPLSLGLTSYRSMGGLPMRTNQTRDKKPTTKPTPTVHKLLGLQERPALGRGGLDAAGPFQRHCGHGRRL
jgi:hypothetical protein